MQMKLGLEQQAQTVAEPFMKTRQKNPSIAINEAGERLIVWAEGISHTRGGRLNMRLMTADGAAQGPAFVEEITLPNFSFPATAQLPDGSFLVLY